MKIKKTKKIKILLPVVLIITIFSGFRIFDDGDDFEITKSLDIFHSVVRDVRLFYVDETDISQLIKESIDDLLKKLDPYTVFYPESDMEDYRFMATGAYGGIGVLVEKRKNKLTIIEVYKNSPAADQELHEGDIIKSINGTKITKKNIKDVKLFLKGEPGSKIEIEIKRYGVDKIIVKNVVRKKIDFGNIQYKCMLSEDIAYINLGQFRMNAANDFKKAFLELKDSNNVKKLVIDLRGNPGGLLIEAVKIVNLFIEKGNKIVSTKGKVKKWNINYLATAEPIAPDIPIVVLVNNSSASASEIVAGAIQDLDRGIVLGRRTYGKGLVQTTRDLSYNTKIKITMAKYYIPSGRCIQAIDYSNRNKDGSIGKIPDSLVSEFKTLNGRNVYDGGGINPDIVVEYKDISPILINLFREHIIFDYATKYYHSRDSIKNIDDFIIDDNEYKKFIEFADNRKFKYTTESIEMVKKLYKTAENEKYDEKIIQNIKKLEIELKRNPIKDFDKFRDEIIPILEQEIIFRYYHKKGKIQKSMKTDKFIEDAKEILDNTNNYNKILSN